MLDLLAKKQNNLFQSDAWADFQAGLKRKSWVVKGDNIQGLVLKYPLIRDKFYLYSPRGPIISKNVKLQDIKLFLRKVEALAKEENAVFYRIEPYLLDQADIYKFGFRRTSPHAPVSQQFSPKNTLVLDITKIEEKILASMKPKWRYNINLSTRKGVKIREGTGHKDIKTFFDLTLEMEKRGGYHGHEFAYYNQMYKALGHKDVLKLFIAEHEGEPLAAILVSFFGQLATYLHGASSNERRELMPTYALQWAAIKEARDRRCRAYDFWGVAPSGAKNHPWTGISRFKRGFGGEELEFRGTYDLPLDKKYYAILKTANRVRKVFKR